MTAPTSPLLLLSFSAMLISAALYNGDIDPTWLYVALLGLMGWVTSAQVLRSNAIPQSWLSAVLLTEVTWLAALR